MIEWIFAWIFAPAINGMVLVLYIGSVWLAFKSCECPVCREGGARK